MRGRTILTILFIIQILFPQHISAISSKVLQTQTVISPDDPYWTGSCTLGEANQSPINIMAPFTYMDFKVDWNLQQYYSGILMNDEGFNLKMNGDFGNFIYEYKTFGIYEIRFKSPSEHTFGPDNKHLPLEMQLSSISPDAIKINIAILFTQADEDGDFLADFGFGTKSDGILQHLSPNQRFGVKQPVDLDKVVPKASNWLIYSGTDTTPPCQPSVWFIAYDTFKVSVRQLDDFPKQLIYKNRKVTIDNREIFSSFKAVKTDQNTEEKPEAISAADALAEPETPAEETEKFNRKKIRMVTKSPIYDSFAFVGDDTPYTDQLYPCLLASPNPRPIGRDDYLVINNPNDPRPYLEYLVFKDEQVKEVLDEIESAKVTKNLAIEEEILKRQRAQLGLPEGEEEEAAAAGAQNSDKNDETQDAKADNKSSENASGAEEAEEEQEEQEEQEEEEEEKKAVLIQESTKAKILNNKSHDQLGVSILGLDKNPKKAETKLVQIVRAPTKKDPSSFFSARSNKVFPKVQKEKNGFLSFLQLKSKVEVLQAVQVDSNSKVEKHLKDPKLEQEIESYFQHLLASDANIETAESTPKRNPNLGSSQGNVKGAPDVHSSIDALVQVEPDVIVAAQMDSEAASEESEGDDESGEQEEEQGEESGEYSGENSGEESEIPEEEPSEPTDVELKEQAEEWKRKPLDVVDVSSDEDDLSDSELVTDSSDSGLYIEKGEGKRIRGSESLDDADIPLKGRPEPCSDDNKSDSSEPSEESIKSDEGEDEPEIKEQRVDENGKMVFGPKVPNQVKKKFAIEQGRGSMSFDRNGNWDGINILDTISWPEFCKLGAHQSPVHISFKTNYLIEPTNLHFDYKKPDDKFVQIKNDGLKLLLTGNFGKIKYGDHPFTVEEIHFHHPSEHTYGDDMERADFEVQIIHRDNFGLTVAVGIMFRNSGAKPHKFLESIGLGSHSNLKPMQPGDNAYLDASVIDLNSLVEGSFDFIRYIGSLTTPPCTEGVYWFLLNNQLDIDDEAIASFKNILGRESNVRGTQPINGRDFWLF